MKINPSEGLQGYTCTPESCNPRCALEVIDDLLRSKPTVRPQELDALLDLRWLLRHRQDAEAAVILFCSLRRTMEERHYLAFYRLRRWLENQVEAVIRLRRGEPEKIAPIKIERYCVEAVRFQCLESIRDGREPLFCPRVKFVFRCPVRGAISCFDSALEKTT
jgi:hypothetical protein